MSATTEEDEPQKKRSKDESGNQIKAKEDSTNQTKDEGELPKGWEKRMSRSNGNSDYSKDLFEGLYE